jgi:N-sulfoglucosamine sulfohydrolase
MAHPSHGDHSLLRKFFGKVLASAAIALLGTQIFCAHTAFAQGDARPNILFIISDDISWAHAGAYGDKVVKTPAFDRIAAEGVLFTNAFCSVSSCSPSRSAILTGQDFWRLGEAANMRGTHYKDLYNVYPFMLEEAGYHVGSHSKGAYPGSIKAGGWPHNPAGPSTDNFQSFLKTLPEDKPFCFWQGASDAHRPYVKGSGSKSGMKVEDVEVPPFFPDVPIVREDILDYYFEVQRFDQFVETNLKLLEDTGRAENTIVVVTSDNGMPFPRGKAYMYDHSARMPLAISWPKGVPGGRVVHDFTNLIDMAPTFLEAAGLKPPPDMTGKSLLALLTSGKQGWVEPGRDATYYGREAHSRHRISYNRRGYPSRAVRTKDFLYIRNFAPDRWPVGREFKDVDPSPTRTYILEHKAEIPRLFDLSFGKRPAEELYDLKKDPAQIVNVAAQARYRNHKQKLSARLEKYLKQTNDPRMGSDGGDVFDNYPIWPRSNSNPQLFERIDRGAKAQE